METGNYIRTLLKSELPRSNGDQKEKKKVLMSRLLHHFADKNSIFSWFL